MTYPDILIIDDKLTLDEDMRTRTCLDCRLLDETMSHNRHYDQSEEPFARAYFCSGQKEGRNSYEEVEKAVSKGLREDGSCRWHLVLLDVEFEEFGRKKNFGLEVREKLLARFANFPLVMLTGRSEEELRASLKKEDAKESIGYLSKTDINDYYLKTKLLKYGNLNSEQKEDLLQLKQNGIVAKSPGMIELFQKAFLSAAVDTSVLIRGETGTGKEVVAKYIHKLSPRRSGPYIVRNISEIPKDLLATELFGIEGKVASEVAGRSGLFLEANKGTFFLDEIGDMPLDSQTQLLRALEERKIVITGDRKKMETPIDVRFLFATAKNLNTLIKAGQFRNDLYKRINQETIHIPPLRERREDIPYLARLYLEEFQKKANRKGTKFSNDALLIFEAQTFPGNVRELKNLVMRVAARKGNDEIISGRDVSRELEDNSWEIPVIVPVPVPPPDIPTPPTHIAPDFAELETLLQNVEVPTSLKELHGKLASLHNAYGQLLQRLLETALQQTKVTKGDGNVLPAIRLLLGNDLKETFQAYRLLNRLNKMFSFSPSPESELDTALRKASVRTEKDTGDLPKLI